jgi:hypothetical protein
MNIDNQNETNLMDLNNHLTATSTSTSNVNSPQPLEQQIYNNQYFSNVPTPTAYTPNDHSNSILNHHLDDHIGNLDSCISELTSVGPLQQFTNDCSINPDQLLDTPTKKTPIKLNTNGNSSKKMKLNKTPATKQQLDSSPTSSPIQHTANKRRKKDPKAPKAPLNGYLVYFNEERASIRQAHANIGFGELTKIIAIKWKELQPSEKQKFNAEAEMDKERYVKEMEEYKQSDAYKNFIKEANASKIQKANEKTALKQQQQQQALPQPPPQQQQQPPMMQQYNIPQQQQQMQWQQQHDMNGATSSTLSASSMNQQQYYYPQQQQQPNQQMYQQMNMQQQQQQGRLPIFNDSFIEHNKQREQDMRQLRKEIGELEQQNSVLNKHIDNMKQSIMKIENECEKYKINNEHVQKKLDLFRHTMLKCFSNLALPHTNEYPTEQTIDDYIYKLFTLLNSNQQQQQQQGQQQGQQTSAAATTTSFVNNIKTILSKFDFNSYIDC